MHYECEQGWLMACLKNEIENCTCLCQLVDNLTVYVFSIFLSSDCTSDNNPETNDLKQNTALYSKSKIN